MSGRRNSPGTRPEAPRTRPHRSIGGGRLLAAGPAAAAHIDDVQRAERRAHPLLDRAAPRARRHRPPRIPRRHPHPPQPRDQVVVRRPLCPTRLDRLAPEDPLRLVLVVRPAEDPDLLHRRPAAPRHRHHVVELEKAGLLAPPAVLPDERAPLPVPRHHLPPHLPRHVALHPAGPRLARCLRLAELPPLDPVEQRIQRPVQHLGQVSRRHLVSQQRLRPQELLVRRLADRDLEREPLRRQRRHSRLVPTRWPRGHLIGRATWWPRGHLIGRATSWPRGQLGLFGHPLDPRRNIRPRRPPRQHAFDLRLALPARLRHQLLGVLVREMRRQQHHSAQMQPRVFHRRPDHREPPHHPRRPDPLERLVLRHAEHLHAVDKHRRAGRRQVQPPRFHLAEVHQHCRGEPPLLPQQLLEPLHHLPIRHRLETNLCHPSSLPRTLDASRRRNQRRTRRRSRFTPRILPSGPQTPASRQPRDPTRRSET